MINHRRLSFKNILTIAKPLNNSDVVAVAFNLALLMCNLLHERPSGPSCSSVCLEEGVGDPGDPAHAQQHVYGMLFIDV